MSITKFLIKKNVVKSESQANMLMIFVILLCVLYFVLKGDSGTPSAPELTEEEMMQMDQEIMFSDEAF